MRRAPHAAPLVSSQVEPPMPSNVEGCLYDPAATYDLQFDEAALICACRRTEAICARISLIIFVAMIVTCPFFA